MNKPKTISMPIGLVEDLIRLIGNLPTSSQAFTVWSPLTAVYSEAVQKFNTEDVDSTSEDNNEN